MRPYSGFLFTLLLAWGFMTCGRAESRMNLDFFGFGDDVGRAIAQDSQRAVLEQAFKAAEANRLKQNQATGNWLFLWGGNLGSAFRYYAGFVNDNGMGTQIATVVCVTNAPIKSLDNNVQFLGSPFSVVIYTVHMLPAPGDMTNLNTRKELTLRLLDGTLKKIRAKGIFRDADQWTAQQIFDRRTVFPQADNARAETATPGNDMSQIPSTGSPPEQMTTPSATTAATATIQQFQPQNRKALVVGNCRYPTSPLSSPVNDGKVMAAVLNQLGFSTSTLFDATTDQISAEISRLGKTLTKNDLVLFYFSGHGGSFNGESVLFQVNKTNPNFVFAPKIMQQLDNAGMVILILDSCRSYQGGETIRAIPIDANSGIFIGFATAPGTTAADGKPTGCSPYTNRLSQRLGQKGLELTDLFKQVYEDVRNDSGGKQIPYFNAAYSGNIILNPN